MRSTRRHRESGNCAGFTSVWRLPPGWHDYSQRVINPGRVRSIEVFFFFMEHFFPQGGFFHTSTRLFLGGCFFETKRLITIRHDMV